MAKGEKNMEMEMNDILSQVDLSEIEGAMNNIDWGMAAGIFTAIL